MKRQHKNARQEPRLDAVVHESESQRQYVRVRMPAWLQLETRRGSVSFPVNNLSAGGAAFTDAENDFREHALLRGKLLMGIDAIEIGIPISLKILRIDRDGVCGCRFEDLGKAEIAALRQLITAYVSGEIVSVGEVLHTLNRENFGPPRRQNAAPASPRGLERLNAMAGTAALLVIGLAAFAFAGSQLYDHVLKAPARSAHVAGPSHLITMPRNGVFHSLVPEDGQVDRGSPLASFETPMLEVVRGEAAAANLTPERINQLINEKVSGTITSPCDCVVKTRYVSDGQYASAGQPVLELLPREFTPHVIAGFSFDNAAMIRQNTKVSFRIAGDPRARHGRVVNVRSIRPQEKLAGDVAITIEPSEDLPASAISRPASVAVSRWPVMLSFIDRFPGAVASDSK